MLTHFCRLQSILTILSLLFLTACSAISGQESLGESISSRSESNQEAVLTTNSIEDFAGRQLTIDQTPLRIVSLVQADMEIIHSLGGEIVGRPAVQDDQALSEELRQIQEVGTAHDVDFEKVISLRPDLVIGHSGLNIKDTGSFEALNVEMVLTRGNSYADILKAIRLHGQVLDRETQAEELVASIEERKEAIEPLEEEVKALIIFGSADSIMAALPTSLAGDLLELAGGVNIASGLPEIDHYPEYAQLSMERVIRANPDVIYFIAHGDAEAVKAKFETELKSNSAWKNLSAVQNDQLVILPPRLFSSNPGPRVAESLEFLHDSLKSIAESSK